MVNNKLSMLMLSCDAYSDLWDDFFNLRDKFWADCPYDWYVVTESKEYKREGVNVIKCGKDLNWSGRFKLAVQSVDTKYIGVTLDDYFIKSPINTNRIRGFVDMMENDDVQFLNLGNVFRSIINLPDKQYFRDHLIIIPQHLRYGIDTAAAIWNKEFLLLKIGEGDYSAWKFETDRCIEADSKNGLGGFLLCDELLSFNVSSIPVVIQGVLYPAAVKYFRDKIGYNIQSNRKQMSFINVIRYKFKVKMSYVPYGRSFLKFIGTHFLGYKFFTK